MSTPSPTPSERLRIAYELEHRLAQRLRDAPPEHRLKVAREVYSELYRSLPWHAELVRSPEQREAIARTLVFSYGRWADEAADVLEIGAGSASVLRAFGRRNPTTRFVGIDVSVESFRNAGEELPANVAFMQAGAAQLPFAQESFEFVYCSQVMEHFHPDDLADHVREVGRVLRPGGWFAFDTPNRITGPHDISWHFTETPTGLHLKEWTYAELRELLLAEGFSRVLARLLPGRVAKGLRFRPPGPLIDARWKVALERPVSMLPSKRLRRAAGRLVGIGAMFCFAQKT